MGGQGAGLGSCPWEPGFPTGTSCPGSAGSRRVPRGRAGGQPPTPTRQGPGPLPALPVCAKTPRFSLRGLETRLFLN